MEKYRLYKQTLIRNYLFLSVFLTALFIVPSIYASNVVRDISPAEKQSILEKLRKLQKDIHSIKAVVNQEKQLSLLKKNIYVEGTVTLKKPYMLRWDTFKPNRSTIVVDGEIMVVYYPEVKEAQVFSLSENMVARNTINFFSTVMWGSISEMERKFNVNMFRKGDEIIFELIPLSKTISRYLLSFIIFYDYKTGLPNGFTVTTPKGDRTITKVTNMKINPEVAPETFQLKLPKDVWITNKPEENN